MPHDSAKTPIAKGTTSPNPAAPASAAEPASVDSLREHYFGHAHLTVIEPPRRFALFNVREIWAYRELLGTLAHRQISVRYKQTVLGAGWAIIQPVMQMIVFTMLFGRMARMPSDGFPYPVFVYSALLPWSYFNNATGAAVGSLVSNSHLLTKVYFPRIIIPLASVVAALVDLAVASSVLVALMLFYGIALTPWLLLAPLLVLGLALTATGIGAGLGALNVSYRDLGHVMPFVMQLWLYATPVVYPVALVPKALQPIVRLNPLTGLIEAFRAIVLGQPPNLPAMGFSFASSAALFLLGMLYFHSVQRRFADLV